MILRFCLSMLDEPHSDPDVERWFSELSQSEETKEIVNTNTKAGYSAIYYAVKMGNIEAVKKLVTLGANLNGQYDGLTLRDVVLQELVRYASREKTDSKNEEDIYKKYQEIEKFLHTQQITFNNKLLIKFIERMAEKEKKDSQFWVESLMKKKGHKLSQGYCFGVAYMGGQALLLEERDAKGNLVHFDNFKHRIARMILFAKKDLYRDIEISRHKRILLVELEKSELKSQRGEKIFPKSMLFEEEYTVPALSYEDRINLEIDPFLEGISLFQDADEHPDLWDEWDWSTSQPAVPALELVPNVALEEQGGGAVIVDQFSGDYNKPKDLIDLLSEIKNIATRPPQYKHPIVLKLGANRHGITVGYDPIKEQWHYIDANHPDKLYRAYTDTHSIAKDIKLGFTNNLEDLKVDILSTAAHAKEMQEKIIDPLHKSKAYKTHGFFARHETTTLGVGVALLLTGGVVSIVPTIGLPMLMIVGIASIGIGSILDNVITSAPKKKDAQMVKKHLTISIEEYEEKQKIKNKNAEVSQSTTASLYSDSFKAIELDEKKKLIEQKQNQLTEPLLQQDSSLSERKSVKQKEEKDDVLVGLEDLDDMELVNEARKFYLQDKATIDENDILVSGLFKFIQEAIRRKIESPNSFPIKNMIGFIAHPNKGKVEALLDQALKCVITPIVNTQ